MNLFGLFKGKPITFLEFRDRARLTLRKRETGAQIVPNDNGFRVIFEDTRPVDCNLRNLYADYLKTPGSLEEILEKWTNSISVSADTPTMLSWTDAQPTLRPILKDGASLELARAHMKKASTPDNLPSEPLLGDLQVIVMQEAHGTLTGVTQVVLDEWGVPFHEVLQKAMVNLDLLSFPKITNEMRMGGKGDAGEVVGLVFEHDHLTAAWLLSERFRDFIMLRLQGEYFVSVANRDRLVAIRTDEPGLLGSVQQSNRSAHLQPHFLTTQIYYVHAGTTGGRLTVYHPSGEGPGIVPGGFFGR